LPAAGDLRASIEAARYGSELWRVFLIAAIVAMIIEMLLARAGKPDAEKTNGKLSGWRMRRRAGETVG
jgi:hypothetical protein